jgi:hypothetical protein
MVFSTLSVPKCNKQHDWWKCSETERIVGGNLVGAVEDLPLLEAITKERLVKIQKAEKI